MDSNEKVIHQERFFGINNLIPIYLLIIAWVISIIIDKDPLSIIVYTAILLVGFILASRRNATYYIYQNRMEIYSPLTNKLMETISLDQLDQLDQVRYEDGFNYTLGYFWSDFIILYPKKDVVLKQHKKNQLSLIITGFNRKTKILKLLKFFQSKGFELVIKTDSKKIHEATGLENWDQR